MNNANMSGSLSALKYCTFSVQLFFFYETIPFSFVLILFILEDALDISYCCFCSPFTNYLQEAESASLFEECRPQLKCQNS